MQISLQLRALFVAACLSACMPAFATDTPVANAWKDKHPKIYKACKRVRTICVFCSPIVGIGANVVTAIAVVVR